MPYQMGGTGLQPSLVGPGDSGQHGGGSHRLPTSLVCLNLATDAIRSLGRDEVLGPRTQRYSDPDA
jgi:hypothetical protein